jgi:hypothetical protein
VTRAAVTRAAVMACVVVVLVVAAVGIGRSGEASRSSSSGLSSVPTDVPLTQPATPTSSVPQTSTTVSAVSAVPDPSTTITTLLVPRRATLAFTGDIITHLAVARQARSNAAESEVEYDFDPMFASVRDELTGVDVGICHLETTLSVGGRFTGFPFFSGPASLADAIARAGYDGCSMASNHAYDFGLEGVNSTLDALDAAGLGHAGTARSVEEAQATTFYVADGIVVAHLSFTYGLNGGPIKSEDLWRVNLIDPDAIVAGAGIARARGAEFVVVSLHWGSEYQRYPTAAQLELAARLDEARTVDLVVGHHAHVIQPLDQVGDLWVFYGLGNFLSNQEPTCCTAFSQDGVIATVVISDSDDGVEVVGIKMTPTWVDRTVMEVVPVEERLAEPDLPRWYRNSLEASLARTIQSLALLDGTAP